jgi:hypothetical protein
MSLDILMLHVLCFLLTSLFSCLSLSLFLNRSQMVEWETILVLVLLVNSTEPLYVCTYVCHVCFDLMRSFLLHPLRSYSLLYVSLSLFFSLSLCLSLSLAFLQLRILSRVLLYYSCYCLWCASEPWSLL